MNTDLNDVFILLLVHDDVTNNNKVKNVKK